MTGQENARIMGQSDAIRVAKKIGKLSESITNERIEFHSVQGKIQQIMEETMAILSPRSTEFFRIPEHRAAYYESFEKQMQLAGLLRIDDNQRTPSTHFASG